MPSRKTEGPVRGNVAAAPRQRGKGGRFIRSHRKIVLPTGISLNVIIGAVVVVLIVVGVGAAYLKGHADGDAAGYARASAYYTKLMADQAAANQAAVDAANATILQQATDLDRKDRNLDAALAQIDASSGGPDASNLGLDAARMKSLNSIR